MKNGVQLYPVFHISNEQIISWLFGDRDFDSGRVIFRGNSLAIAEKNKEVLEQKIIGEIVKLLFTCYLVSDGTKLALVYLILPHSANRPV